MDTLVVVPCSRLKIWDVRKDVPRLVPAREVYLGPVTRLAIRYAETRKLPYVILSGKYGFLYPWEEVEQYDRKLRLDKNFLKMLRQQVFEKSLDKYRKVLCLCPGKTYPSAVKYAFRNIAEIEAPLEGLNYIKALTTLSKMVKTTTTHLH